MGVHPRAIQAILGCDQGVMLDRYTHLVDEIRRDAAEKMGAVLEPVRITVGVKSDESKPKLIRMLLKEMVNAVGIEPTTY